MFDSIINFLLFINGFIYIHWFWTVYTAPQQVYNKRMADNVIPIILLGKKTREFYLTTDLK